MVMKSNAWLDYTSGKSVATRPSGCENVLLSIIHVVRGGPAGAKVDSGVCVTYPWASLRRPLSNCCAVLLRRAVEAGVTNKSVGCPLC